MKVIHVNYWDTFGGAARCSNRIHNEMLRAGEDSVLYTGFPASYVARPKASFPINGNSVLLRFLDACVGKIQYRLGIEDYFYPSSALLRYRRSVRDADIIQLYNIHGGYFGLSAVKSLSKIAPVVWWLADMWPITGHCPYADKCDHWKNRCGECDLWREYPETINRDTTSLNWRIKKKIYAQSDIHFVSPSMWLKNLAEQSPLTRGHEIRLIPNGIDIKTFKPVDKVMSRRMLNLPEDKLLIIVENAVFGNKRKGTEFIPKILSMLKQSAHSDRIMIVSFGGIGQNHESGEIHGLPITRFGYISDDYLLACIYNACDITVHPAENENLSNHVQESMACGTPAVCFKVGGMPETVRDGEDGFIVERGDVNAFVSRIINYASNKSLIDAMRVNARKRIVNDFSSEKELRMHLALYQELLERNQVI